VIPEDKKEANPNLDSNQEKVMADESKKEESKSTLAAVITQPEQDNGEQTASISN